MQACGAFAYGEVGFTARASAFAHNCMMKESPPHLPVTSELSGKTRTGVDWVAGNSLTAVRDNGSKPKQVATREAQKGHSMNQPLAVIAMKCPGCGAGLQISKDMEYFACSYCGTSIRAIRQGGAISLIADAIAKVQLGTDRTAAELALVRLRRELDELDSKLATMNQPAEPMKIRSSFFLDPVWTYLSARKANREIEEWYQKKCKDWEINVKPEVDRYLERRKEIVVQIASLKKVVDQPL